MTNRKTGMLSSIINFAAVISFAVCMLIGSDFGNYFSSMFIAFSFVPMMCTHAHFTKEKAKAAGYTAVSFASMYAAIILLVYFAQLTTVRNENLTPQASSLLDFQSFGLLFNYDLLGYALMALATFFAGLTLEVKSKPDRSFIVSALLQM